MSALGASIRSTGRTSDLPACERVPGSRRHASSCSRPKVFQTRVYSPCRPTPPYETVTRGPDTATPALLSREAGVTVFVPPNMDKIPSFESAVKLTSTGAGSGAVRVANPGRSGAATAGAEMRSPLPAVNEQVQPAKVTARFPGETQGTPPVGHRLYSDHAMGVAPARPTTARSETVRLECPMGARVSS